MNDVPARAGLDNPTFSPEQGEEVFLCLKSEPKHSAISRSSSPG
jgi:hypothetical protein